MTSDQVLLWDFDGTLAERPGKWSAALLEALEMIEPGHSLTWAQISSCLSSGFPWHDYHVAHPELSDPELWWRHLTAVLTGALVKLDMAPVRAVATASLVRSLYTDPTTWRPFVDSFPALRRLTAAGWRHALVSNHVPELPLLLEGLGMGGFFEAVINSAVTGYEKPHPEAFRLALQAVGWPRRVWMIGDSVSADIRGAEQSGIGAILVRKRHPSARLQADDLLAAIRLIEHHSGQG